MKKGKIMIERGDIFYVDGRGCTVGSEYYGTRPAVVISNNKCNSNSGVVEVVFCTTAYKSHLPTHIEILSTPRPSTVICEQITSVSVKRLGEYIGMCSAEEMQKIDSAILISLGLNKQGGPPDATDASFSTVDAELSLYKRLYSEIIEKIIQKGEKKND